MDLFPATPNQIDDAANACMPGYLSARVSLELLGTTALFRAVESSSRSIEMVPDIRYPPTEIVTQYARAKLPGSPVYYGANDSDTAILELRPRIWDRLVISEWRLIGSRPPLVCEMGLLETLDRLHPSLAQRLRRLLEPSIEIGLSAEDLEIQRRVRGFLSRQFTRVVAPGHEHEIRLSAAIAARLLKQSDGIIYASVATVRSGVNIALNPDSLDELYLPVTCQELEITESLGNDRYKARQLRRANTISSDGQINWR